jgi:phenol 2-monooxygenase
VIDIVPITDFPDICYPGFIESECGSMLILPRERNMTRLYVPFKAVNNGEGDDNTRDSIDLDTIRRRAQTFFKGYTFDFKVCEWWSVYKVGQRVAEHSSNPGNRIFLAGDAVHMHSPKIGLGMNTSMQDGYNLGWKVALATSGALADPGALLATYQAERLPVANKLVEFDRILYSPEGTVDPEAFLKTHGAFQQFADGRSLMYPESSIVSKTASSQSAAQNLLVGESFIHAKVVGHANSQLYWTTRLFASDGRFRVVLLAGNVDSEAQLARVGKFCSRLQSGDGEEQSKATPPPPPTLLTRYRYPFSPASRYSKTGADPTGRQHPDIAFEHERPLQSMISLLTIHSGQNYASRSLFDLPEILRGPFDPNYHGWDYGRIFVDAAVHYDRYCDGRAYDMWGVDRGRGAVVVVRPDMHVGWVGELEDVGALDAYFVSVFGH